ncbi:hypothetical protein ASD21_20670 [Caulobacter sp. Root1455]|uniref:DMP19 family protein n=1 Tax=Caulobacter sp. Root1455 TaxID=1736465 RepID=UPI0006FB0AC8|nr:DUF4375 domain-containing protein [Caulobacter sp. Root1455]KQZ03219.1 hypothetical protein ASD21_20670 [Caulobacter sp. Root1455]
MSDSGYVALIEPYQDKLNIYGGAEAFESDLAVMPEKVRVLLLADLTMGEVCNGGFWQYFSNSSGIVAPEAVAAFDTLGLPNMANMVRATMGFFGADYPREREQRQAALKAHDEAHRTKENAGLEYLSPFEAADEAFYMLMAAEGGGFDVAADRYAQAEVQP